MNIIDGHSHMYQTYASSNKLKRSVKEIENFDAKLLLKRLDEIGISQFQTMAQEMTRISDHWLGSNDLSANIQHCEPSRIVAYAGAEPLDTRDCLNIPRLNEVKEAILERGLKGFLLTPPYGHYYSNDKRIYPFYEMAIELNVPIYFHHSHMFGPPKNCPLKYARIYLLDDLTIDFPELRFNVEHMGYPWTEELLAIMCRSPNVYTDIAVYIDVGLKRIMARNLGMAREYGVLDRVFYGSDYVGENVDEYISRLNRDIAYLMDGVNSDMDKFGFDPLSPQEMEGLLSTNVLKLWKQLG